MKEESFYIQMIDKASFGYAYNKMIYAGSGQPADWELLEVNPAFEALTGLSARKIINQRATQVFPGIFDDNFNWLEEFGKIAANQGNKEFEEYSTALGRGFRIQCFSWEKDYFAIVFSESVSREQDIRKRRSLEQELRDSHALLTNLARLVPGVIYQYRLYPDGRSTFPYASPGMKDIYEFTPEEVREDATPVFGRLHPEDYKHVADSIQESAASLNTFYCEFRVLLPRQGLRWRWSQAQPERTADGGTLWHGVILDVTERKLAEEKLLFSHHLMSYIIEHSRGAVAVHDRDMKYLYVSRRYLDEYNVREKDVIGKNHYEIFPDLPQKWRDVHKEALTGIISRADNDPYYHEDGSVDWTSWECRPWYDQNGSIGGIIVYTEVINERKNAEDERAALQAQLAQSQKMESIGRLAGGVAHDFNNMLGVILGHSELALETLEPRQPLFKNLEEIIKAAERSADLTRQLLAFARKQNVSPKVLNLNSTLQGMLKMLERLIGEDINLSWKPGDELWNIKIDPSQLDQILANLCVNARDAIRDTGKVSIETDNVTLDSAYCAVHPELLPGEYCVLSVSDNGSGMDKETRLKIFEPFFTTKEQGKGTGLGLSTVFGIVKQNRGQINVYSEPGKGTTFRIYLPRYAGEINPDIQDLNGTINSYGTETILIVEDEESILTLAQTILEQLGYTVFAVSTPAEALRLARDNCNHIQLLITDVIMPEINGKKLANKLMDFCPHMKILFMSGYTADAIVQHGVLDPDVSFIQKPFSVREFGSKVRSLLDTH